MLTATPAVARSFPPEAASVPAARRYVRSLLLDAGQHRWIEPALLVVSELTTNAVLHAHTAFEVVVQTSPDGVHVQVWDDDAELPARRFSAASATTGRGMELVEAVATSYGVQAVGPAKVVWFTLGTVPPGAAADVLLDRWRDRPDAEPAPGSAPAREVFLLGMPLALWLAAREHHNCLLREYSLHEQADEGTGRAVPAALVAADRGRSLILDALRKVEVQPAVDLVLRVRPDQAHWFEALRDVLDRAEALAVAGELLAAPGPASILDVRHWAAGQVLRQLDGGSPQAWRGALGLPVPRPRAVLAAR